LHSCKLTFQSFLFINFPNIECLNVWKYNPMGCPFLADVEKLIGILVKKRFYSLFGCLPSYWKEQKSVIDLEHWVLFHLPIDVFLPVAFNASWWASTCPFCKGIGNIIRKKRDAPLFSNRKSNYDELLFR